jgi:hypothetical protein
MIWRLFGLWLFLPALLCSADFSDYDASQGKWTRAELEERLGRFLLKEGNISSYFSLTPKELVLYNLPETQKDREVEYRLALADVQAEAEKAPTRKDLVGVKVAIDPGHFGGPYARLEERFIDIPPFARAGKDDPV